MCKAEVGARVDTKLGAYPPVRWHVVLVVHLFEGGFARQYAFSLNVTQLVQDREIDVNKL